MSAIRYCGELRIRVTYVDQAAWERGEPAFYRCTITNVPNGERHVKHVMPPTFETVARDSSEAFDLAAHAALSFAAHDGWPVESYGLTTEDGSGWHITRKPQDLVRMSQDTLIAGAHRR